MRLLRNDAARGGRGKYAVVRLRDVVPGTQADRLLQELHELGVVDFGEVDTPSEFFVMKLRDIHARSALLSYADSVRLTAERLSAPQHIIAGIAQYGNDVRELAERAGPLSPWCKDPDCF